MQGKAGFIKINNYGAHHGINDWPKWALIGEEG
jgi:hypothetical protein